MGELGVIMVEPLPSPTSQQEAIQQEHLWPFRDTARLFQSESKYVCNMLTNYGHVCNTVVMSDTSLQCTRETISSIGMCIRISCPNSV